MLELGSRFFEVIHAAQCETKIVSGIGMIGVELDGLPKHPSRFVITAEGLAARYRRDTMRRSPGYGACSLHQRLSSRKLIQTNPRLGRG